MRTVHYEFVTVRYQLRQDMWQEQVYSPATIMFCSDGFVQVRGRRRDDITNEITDVTDQYPAKGVISIEGKEKQKSDGNA